MSRTNPKKPKDGQDLEKITRKRYTLDSGQSHSHGMINYRVLTQESQSFSFHSSTGQGESAGGGPGTGRAVLYTPGMSMEVLGQGLKVKGPGDDVPNYAKIITCDKGDMLFDARDGNITLRARNINIEAFGGGDDGTVSIDGAKVVNVNSPDVRLRGEKVTIVADNTMHVVSQGFMEISYNFNLSASSSDLDFGFISQVLKERKLKLTDLT